MDDGGVQAVIKVSWHSIPNPGLATLVCTVTSSIYSSGAYSLFFISVLYMFIVQWLVNPCIVVSLNCYTFFCCYFHIIILLFTLHNLFVLWVMFFIFTMYFSVSSDFLYCICLGCCCDRAMDHSASIKLHSLGTQDSKQQSTFWLLVGSWVY